MAKSKWTQVKHKLALVEKWARDELDEKQIARNLGISNKITKDGYCRLKIRLNDFINMAR